MFNVVIRGGKSVVLGQLPSLVNRRRDRRNAVRISQLTALRASPIVGQLRFATKEERA